MSEGAFNAPAPSKFAFIHELASLPPATKVRFLGCIVDYDLGKGELLLEHAYPIHAHPVPRISVDINLVLESTHSSALQQGSWINVIGYTRVSRTRGRPKKQSLPGTRIEGVSLQAILIWSAGSLRIGEYEATLEEQRLLQQRLKSDSM